MNSTHQFRTWVRKYLYLTNRKYKNIISLVRGLREEKKLTIDWLFNKLLLNNPDAIYANLFIHDCSLGL